MTIVNPNSTYLKADFCIANNIREVIIASEASEVAKEFQGKVTNRVQCEVECLPTKEKKTWSMNNASVRTLVQVFGPETKVWAGKKVRLQFVDTNTGKSVQIDELETRNLNKPQ